MKAKQAKIERDYNLAGLIRERYQEAAQVVPFVVGVLRTISRNLSTLRDALGIPDIIGCTQMTALFGTAHVPKKVLSFSCG